MKYSILGMCMLLFGVFGLVFIVLFQSIIINNESEYYVLKEAMEAAMLESVDLACFAIGDSEGYVDLDGDGNRDDVDGNGTIDINDKVACGNNDIKIIEQKFVENFTRRFASSIVGDASDYEIEFYDIIESPPKATVVIKAKTQEYNISFSDLDSVDSFTIVNELSGILEFYHED